MTTDDADIGILAATAYATGIDPVTYATENVIEAHVVSWLGPAADLAHAGRLGGRMPPAELSRRILGDLLDAGWTPPEVTR
jgi:hypothetical protein